MESEENRTRPGYWLAVDQGTTSTRATLFDQNGQVVAKSKRRVDIVRGPQAGHVEQDAAQIANGVDEAISEVVGAVKDPERILGAGLATQRSSVVAWDRETGQPLSRVLSWQDTRCQNQIDSMHARAAEVQQRTGLPLTAHYGARNHFSSRRRRPFDHRSARQFRRAKHACASRRSATRGKRRSRQWWSHPIDECGQR